MIEVTDKDAVELLDADHIAVKHLFVEYARMAVSGMDEAGERRSLAMQICDELTVHAQIEEEIFYPALRGVPDAGELLDEAESEHAEAKQLIAQIQAERAAGETMDELVSKLATSVEHHVKEERCYLFAKAKAARGVDLAALGEQMRERQQQLQGQGQAKKKRPAGR
ncbi:hemerythrin domain-containing protein [Ramlibacter albus]|uniref:Hemerythrin domain-containing protein n=1 Tax=Ramlibacter albus TaxID=2079448 RepID=A0A923M8F8_9BURK|nr:hemerythrin domain-containing protein [Ramlibacter albus]MBC5764432.1 hemerythrin domain-containing protein [Ramlibacter albus]